jgi:hypothetical protein
VEGSCEHGNENMGSTKYWEFFFLTVDRESSVIKTSSLKNVTLHYIKLFFLDPKLE